MRPNPQESADLVTFTEEILNGKLHFLCSVKYQMFDRILNAPLGGGGCTKNNANVVDFKAQEEHYTTDINRQSVDM